MTTTSCSVCSGSKGKYSCKSCQAVVCKDCANFIDDGRVELLEPVRKTALVGVYCGPCFNGQPSDEISRYDQTFEAAGQVLIFSKDQGKETRLIKRTEKPIRVTDCAGHDETIMQMAFLAAQGGFNCLLDVDVKSEKSYEGSFKILKWSGSGIPASVDRKRYDR